jgi:hypothetical protein
MGIAIAIEKPRPIPKADFADCFGIQKLPSQYCLGMLTSWSSRIRVGNIVDSTPAKKRGPLAQLAEQLTLNQ